MVVIMKPGFTQEQLESAVHAMEEGGVKVMVSKGSETTILGAEGNAANIDQEKVSLLPGVDRVMRVTEPYKKANRKYHPDDTVVDLGNGTAVGGRKLAVIAGPCSVESEGQIVGVAEAVKTAGAAALRGGAYKPRTSPYSFQGLEEEGLRYMQEAKKETGLATICEVVSNEAIEAAVKYVDMIQIGARNMQNFILLKEAGRSGLPVLLKRGLSATIDEWLNAAEYIIAEGNPNVVLCERGIRTFETTTRNTLDLSAVPVLKEKTHLPVIVDPSHATGVYKYVSPLAKAAVACGADGLMIEVHNDPAHALSDGPQSLTFEKFARLTEELTPYARLAGRTFR